MRWFDAWVTAAKMGAGKVALSFCQVLFLTSGRFERGITHSSHCCIFHKMCQETNSTQKKRKTGWGQKSVLQRLIFWPKRSKTQSSALYMSKESFLYVGEINRVLGRLLWPILQFPNALVVTAWESSITKIFFNSLLVTQYCVVLKYRPHAALSMPGQ